MALKFILRVLIVSTPVIIIHCTPQAIPDPYAIKEDITDRLLLNIQIDLRYETPHITVTCFDHESLDNLNLANFEELEFGTALGIHLNFVDCFNNETHHKNYQQFKLHNAIGDVQSYVNCENFEINFNDYGLVDGGTFFAEIDLARYKNVEIYSIGFMDNPFLKHVQSGRFFLRQTNHANFNDFSINTITDFYSEANPIMNFTKLNLAKFTMIKILKISEFTIDDYEVLNVPNLFERNIYLETLGFENLTGDGVLILDEAVFNGLHRLTYLDLKGINLETIPTNLFSDLPELDSVNLENNNLINLDHGTFVNNPALSRLQLGGNKIFLSQNVYLVLRNEKITIDILRSQFSGFDSLSQLIANSNIRFMNLHESNLKNFELSDFDQIHDRSRPIHITMNDAEMKFSIGQLRAQRINYEIFPYLMTQQIEELNAIVYISADDTNLCRECDFIRDIFLYYLDGLPEDVDIYLRDSKVLIKMLIRCTDLEKLYAYPFKYNCPPNCECKFNPLLDKVYINCSDRGLEAIPKIPYPTQFRTIDSINLDMSKNFLNTINFDNQHDDVLKVLSTFDFTDNEIMSIRLKKKAPLIIHDIKLCGNEFLQNDNIVISLNINEQWTNVTKAHCELGAPYPKNVNKYILNKTPEHIYDILSTVRCNL